MDEKKKGNNFFRKILKGIGAFFLIIIVVAVLGVAGAWLNGTLNPDKIYIQKLTINGVKEYVAITENDSSFTTTISYEPAEANQLTLTPRILTGGDLIEPLTNVVAGQPLTLQFKKHENGVTKGGEVEIKFIDSAQQAFTTLKVLIDVGLDSRHLEVSSNGDSNLNVDINTNVISTNVLTTVSRESANTIKISANYDEMLNSYKGNWSESENNSTVNLDKLKKMILRYDEDVRVRDFEITEVMGDENYYLIKYLTPATTEMKPFELKIYLYKTYFLERVFEEKLANDIFKALDEENFEKASFDYDKLNEFINSYVYEASSVDVKNNFNVFIENGVIRLSPAKYARNSVQFIQALNDTLNYVFATKTLHISVKNIQVSNIINQKLSEPVPFSVLQTFTYTTQDLQEKLGLSLQGADVNTDQQVLLNALRGIDIVLCHMQDKEEYNTIIQNASKEERMQIIKEYFKIGANYYKKSDATGVDSKFSITKNFADDGSVTWTLQSLSPTGSSDKYYLLYLYTGNDFEKQQEIVLDVDGKENRFQYNNTEDAWYRIGNGGTKTLLVDLDLISRCYNWKLACSPLEVTFTRSSISYNESQDDLGNDIVKNKSNTLIVLNEKNTIYKNVLYNGQNTKVSVGHGDQGGVYYKSRNMTVGIKDSTSSIADTNVIIQSLGSSKDLQYTHVKWFVKYNDNIFIADDGETRYYFKPVINVAFDDSATNQENKENEVPVKYRLKEVDGDAFLGSENDFYMEIGNNNFNLEALNAMVGEAQMTLYAVIIQTNINGDPIEYNVVNNEHGLQKTLYYIDYSSDHKISSTKLIEQLNFYHQNYDEDGNYIYINSTTQNNNITQINFLEIVHGNLLPLYLTSFNLNAAGHPILSNGDWVEGNKIIMKNAVDVERNEKIALTRFYNDFIKLSTGPGDSWTYKEYDQGIDYPLINPTITHEASMTEDSIISQYYIAFNIYNNNPTIAGAWAYYLDVSSDNNSLQNIMYTSVSTYGFFKLCEDAGSES